MSEPTTSRLANFFNKQREIIEAAETPFSKLAIFILPILSPIVPASLTGLNLFKLFLIIFTFSGANNLSIFLSVLVSLVLELLGYVGAISFIQAVFRLVKTRNMLYALPAILNGCAYVFYLILMFLINYKLGEYFQTPDIINTVVGILSFVTVPTGLLAANYLSQKEIKEDEKEIRKESREERLEKARIRAGGNPAAVMNEQNVRSVKQRTKSTNERSERTSNGELRTFVIQLLDEHERTNRSVAGVSDIARTVARTVNEHNGVMNEDGSPNDTGYERYKGYVSEVRKQWLGNHQEYVQ